MSRIDANITKQKRRRHSSEPSPNSILTPDHKPLRKKLNFDSDLHIDLLEMQGDNSVLSPHVSVSSENSAKAPTEKHSFDGKKSLFTDDDVQRLAMAVKNLMLDDLRKELRQDMHLCINNATSPLYAEIQQLKQENFNLKKSIGEIPKINSKLDDLEQHSRKSCVRISGVPESVGENTADIVCDIAKKLNVNLVSNDISVSHRLPSAKGHKQIIARFTHAQKRSELLKATKNIPKIPDLKGIGISQDLTKNRSKIAYLARQAVKQKQIKSTSVRDGKIFITDKADNRKIITCEDELNAILNTGCDNQDGTFNINLSIPPPQSHGMFVVRPPSPALLSQQGIPLGLPQIPCQPHMLNQFMPNMFGSQLM